MIDNKAAPIWCGLYSAKEKWIFLFMGLTFWKNWV